MGDKTLMLLFLAAYLFILGILYMSVMGYFGDQPQDFDSIVNGVLGKDGSRFGSTSSSQDISNWDSLYFTVFSGSHWEPQHHLALEFLFAHSPQAILLVLTTSPNLDETSVFQDLQDFGFRIFVVRITKGFMERNNWFVGYFTRRWIQQWPHEAENFHVHLHDYLRLVTLYKYGGTFVDLDFLWLRPATGEFLATSKANYDAEFFNEDEQLELFSKVLRLRKGHRLLLSAAETSFEFVIH
jgi:hypothetical protein